MKNKTYKIAMLILAVLALIILSSFPVQAKKAKTRTTTGTYYDYMTIVTKDGNEWLEWLLSDKQSKKNPYMRWDKKHKVYKARFKNGQKVEVTFNTKGTKKKSDDRIVSVRILKQKHK